MFLNSATIIAVIIEIGGNAPDEIYQYEYAGIGAV